MWTSWSPTSRRKSNTNRKKRMDAGRKTRFPASFFMSRKWHKAARVHKTFVFWKTAAEVKVGSAHSISEKERACFV